MIEQKASYDDDALIYVFVTLYYKQPKTIMKDNQLAMKSTTVIYLNFDDATNNITMNVKCQ